MFEALDRDEIHAILSLAGNDNDWRGELERLKRGDTTLTRRSAHEGAIRAVQRLLIFLGYSTTASGAFSVDGDFGRGTNRGIAQFQFEQGLATPVSRDQLVYPCSFQNARSRIVAIPESRLELETINEMLNRAAEVIDRKEVSLGSLDEALFHLNALQGRRFLSCREILERYEGAAREALARVAEEKGVEIQLEWVLSIIRQETSGIVRPRFEQHKLSKFAAQDPGGDLQELRLRSMSIGLGQIMGFNHAAVGAPSAKAMLTSSLSEQIAYVARFLCGRKNVVVKKEPTRDDFRALARFYNGPAFARHFYDESLERWFREFRRLLA